MARVQLTLHRLLLGLLLHSPCALPHPVSQPSSRHWADGWAQLDPGQSHPQFQTQGAEGVGCETFRRRHSRVLCSQPRAYHEPRGERDRKWLSPHSPVYLEHGMDGRAGGQLTEPLPSVFIS